MTAGRVSALSYAVTRRASSGSQRPCCVAWFSVPSEQTTDACNTPSPQTESTWILISYAGWDRESLADESSPGCSSDRGAENGCA